MEGRITHDEIQACIRLLEKRMILPDLIPHGTCVIASWVKPIAPTYRLGLVFILNRSIQQRLEAITPQRCLR